MYTYTYIYIYIYIQVHTRCTCIHARTHRYHGLQRASVMLCMYARIYSYRLLNECVSYAACTHICIHIGFKPPFKLHIYIIPRLRANIHTYKHTHIHIHKPSPRFFKVNRSILILGARINVPPVTKSIQITRKVPGVILCPGTLNRTIRARPSPETFALPVIPAYPVITARPGRPAPAFYVTSRTCPASLAHTRPVKHATSFCGAYSCVLAASVQCTPHGFDDADWIWEGVGERARGREGGKKSADVGGIGF
jgi:hypothetical protein